MTLIFLWSISRMQRWMRKLRNIRYLIHLREIQVGDAIGWRNERNVCYILDFTSANLFTGVHFSQARTGDSSRADCTCPLTEPRPCCTTHTSSSGKHIGHWVMTRSDHWKFKWKPASGLLPGISEAHATAGYFTMYVSGSWHGTHWTTVKSHGSGYPPLHHVNSHTQTSHDFEHIASYRNLANSFHA